MRQAEEALRAEERRVFEAAEAKRREEAEEAAQLAADEAEAKADAEEHELELWLTKKKFGDADLLMEALGIGSLLDLALVTRADLDDKCSDFMRNPDKARLLKEAANSKNVAKLLKAKRRRDEALAALAAAEERGGAS